MPQPNLVPVSPSVSRSTHRSGVSGVTLTVSRLPLTVKLIGGMTGHPRGRWEKRVRADARMEGGPLHLLGARIRGARLGPLRGPVHAVQTAVPAPLDDFWNGVHI